MVHRVRVILIVSGALALAGCESQPDWMKSTPDWMKPPDWMKMNTDAFKTQPVMDTVRFESEPPGAEARASSGQTCRTPCALALPVSAPLTVTFTLNGFQPESEKLDLITQTGSPTQLGPNPVYVELTPAPPSKPVKKPPPKKKPAAKQAAKPVARAKPAAAAGSALAPMSAEPSQLAPAPWPSAQPQR
jgi:hypothetical protein